MIFLCVGYFHLTRSDGTIFVFSGFPSCDCETFRSSHAARQQLCFSYLSSRSALFKSSHVFDTSISQHVSSRSTIQTPYTTHPRLQKQWAEARGYEIVRRNHSKDKFDKIRKIWVIRGKGGKIRSIKSLNDGEPPQGS